jgi:hypothetical protein
MFKTTNHSSFLFHSFHFEIERKRIEKKQTNTKGGKVLRVDEYYFDSKRTRTSQDILKFSKNDEKSVEVEV